MEKELEHLVSNIEIEKKFSRNRDQIQIYVYSGLNDVESILNILPLDVCACFVLLRTSEQSGHWTCLCRNGNNIYYFDSYGIAPDGELSKIATNTRYELDETQQNLIRLMQSIPSGFVFSYNNMQFQEYSSNINTCGKWCYAFSKCVFKGLTLDAFQSRLKRLKEQYNLSYDEIVCMLWTTL